MTLKRIIVSSKDQITVALDFFNHLDKNLKIGASYGDEPPSLTDEKGDVFEYRSGIAREVFLQHMIQRASILNPKSNNDVVLYFRPEDRDTNIKDIGFSFTFSLTYILYDPQDKSDSKYTVTFTDIKAQRPK